MKRDRKEKEKEKETLSLVDSNEDTRSFPVNASIPLVLVHNSCYPSAMDWDR